MRELTQLPRVFDRTEGLSAPASLVCVISLIPALQCGGIRTGGAVTVCVAAGTVGPSHFGHPRFSRAGRDKGRDRSGCRARHGGTSGPRPNVRSCCPRRASEVCHCRGFQGRRSTCVTKVASPMSVTSQLWTCWRLAGAAHVERVACTDIGTRLPCKQFGPFAAECQPRCSPYGTRLSPDRSSRPSERERAQPGSSVVSPSR